MEAAVITGSGVAALLVLVRAYAVLHAAAGQAEFMWLMFVPTLIGGFVLLGAGIRLLVTSPPTGIVMAVTGSVYLAALLGFLTRASLSVTSSGPRALTEPLDDYVRTLIGLLLIGALVAAVGLGVWGVSQGAR
jgi:hypothetical protein